MAKKKLRLKGANLTTDELLAKLDELGVELDNESEAKSVSEEPVKQKQEAPKPTLKREERSEKPALPRLPKMGAKGVSLTKKKLEFPDGKLEVDSGDELAQEDFEALCVQYNESKAKANALKKEIDEDRETILNVMGQNVQFTGDTCDVSIAPIKNESINAPLVVETLVEQDPSQLIDLAKLGIISVSKSNFEKWLKSAGLDAEPFIIKGRPKQRLTVRPKRRK